MTTVITTTTGVSVDSMGYDDWWCPCGITPDDAVGAYLAKGAGSYANSKINLINENNYPIYDDGDEGVPWDDVNGWRLNNSFLYIYNPPTSENTTIAIRYSDMVVGADNYKLISKYITGKNTWILQSNSEGGAILYACDTYSCQINNIYTSGVVVGANKWLYHNGGLIGTIPSTPTTFSEDENPMYIGSEDGASEFSVVNIQAIALYNKVLTPTQIADLTTAMNAL